MSLRSKRQQHHTSEATNKYLITVPAMAAPSPSHSKLNATSTPTRATASCLQVEPLLQCFSPLAATASRLQVEPLVGSLFEERPFKLLHLDSCLFPDGLQSGDVVEVFGSANSGKSMLTLTLIAAALLPPTWCGIQLGGCSTGVTLIDCDLHFSIFQLVNIMYKRVKGQLKLANEALRRQRQDKACDATLIHNAADVRKLLQNDRSSLKSKIEEMVHNCLKSLSYIRCKDSVCFPIVLASMDEHLEKHSSVSLVVVDSISAFCWYDKIYRANTWKMFKNYYDGIFKVLVNHIAKYKAILLAVKHPLFEGRSVENTRKGPNHNEYEEEEELEDEVRNVENIENDEDMEENDDRENVTESEYFGQAWVSSVTCSVLLSKMRTTCVTKSSHKSFETKSKDSSASVSDISFDSGAKASPHSSRVGCEGSEGKERLFSALVIKDKLKRKLFFTINEEGVRWRPCPQILQ